MNLQSYCNYCDSFLDIGPSNTNTNKHSDDTIIQKVVQGLPLTVTVDAKQLQSIKKSPEFEAQSKEMQDAIIKKLQYKGVILLCNNCGWSDALTPGTIISTSYCNKNEYVEQIDAVSSEYLTHDKTLPHTVNFICPTKGCKSKHAVMVKQSNSNVITYICRECKAVF